MTKVKYFESDFIKVISNTNGLKDMMPSCWEKTDNGYRCVVKTLGISDVNITIEDYGIMLTGSNELEGKVYDTTVELPIAQDVLDNVEEIKHKTINGITFVDLIVNRPEKKKIKIEKIY